jgi:hypothetical protein
VDLFVDHGTLQAKIEKMRGILTPGWTHSNQNGNRHSQKRSFHCCSPLLVPRLRRWVSQKYPGLKVTVCRFVSNPPLTDSRPLGEICYKTGKRKLAGVLVNFQAVICIRALLFTTEAQRFGNPKSEYRNPKQIRIFKIKMI